MKLVKYPEVESIRQTAKVEIAPGVEIEVQDLPPTYQDKLQSVLPAPRPPKVGVLRDHRGMIIRDERNHPEIEYDFTAEDYIKALAVHQRRSLVFFLIEGSVDGQLVFDAQQNGQNPAEFYDKVIDELEAFGWGLGQMNKVADRVMELSGIGERDLEEAAGDFTDPGTG